MNSFISNFRDLFVAALVIGSLEIGVYLLDLPQEHNSNVLSLALTKPEPVTRVFINYKVKAFADRKPDIIQVGDSSGFYGMQPLLVMEHLERLTYLNLSCNARSGFEGAQSIAMTAIRDNPNAKLLVYYATPFYLVGREFDDPSLIESLYSEYESVARLLQPPSTVFRLPMTNFIVTGDPAMTLLSDRVARYWRTDYDVYQHSLFGTFDTWGWMVRPGKRRRAIPTGVLSLPLERNSWALGRKHEFVLRDRLEGMAEFARRNGLGFALILNPTAQQRGDGKGVEEMERVIKEFQEAYPWVYIPFPVVTTFPLDQFIDPWHLNEAGSAVQSHRVGEALADYFAMQQRDGVDEKR